MIRQVFDSNRLVRRVFAIVTATGDDPTSCRCYIVTFSLESKRELYLTLS